MRKFSWNKFLNISIAVLIICTLGVILYLSCFYKSKDTAKAAELVTGVPFKIGVAKRSASSLKSNHYSYTEDEKVYNGDLETIEDGAFVMLKNYKSEQQLINSSSSTAPIENAYVSFGAQEEGVLLPNLIVTLKVNGEDISINNATIYETENLPDNNTEARYWFGYFDGKDLTTKDGRTVSGEGLYEFQFDYAVCVDNKIDTGKTYKYSFYILDQNQYDNYPVFNSSAVQGKNDNSKIVQYYYNFTKDTLPTLTFDASRYNIRYVREKNKETDSVTSSFEIDTSTKEGYLTLTKTVNGESKNQRIRIVKNENDEYMTTLTFEDLGTYSFEIRYLVNISTGIKSEFVVTEDIFAYDIKDKDVNGKNRYETGDNQKGRAKLHIFGVKAYFSKDGKTELKHEDTKADITSLLYDTYTKAPEIMNPGFMSEKTYNTADGTINNPLFTLDGENRIYNFNYPKTNMPTISFDCYGTYSINGDRPQSVYRIYTDNQFSVQATKGSGYITKDTSLDNTGYYEVIIAYTYNNYTDTTTGGSNTIHKQAFVFQIHNSTPNLTLNRVDDGSEIKNESFVNTGVSATWTDATYFEAPISATYTKYDFNGNVLAKNMPVTKDQVIGDGESGKYEVKIYLNRDNTAGNEPINIGYKYVIDKDPISNININPIYARKNPITGSVIGYAISNDRNEVDISNSFIINQPFTLTYSKKPSGASINTVYYKIPFIANSNAGRLFTNDSKEYIETNYMIDVDNMDGGSPYNFDYSSLDTGLISSENAFLDDVSNIYVFELKDEAGNTASKFMIYDLTKPYVIVDTDLTKDGIQNIENPYGIITDKAQITWGNYKSIRINATVTDNRINNVKMQDIIERATGYFSLVNNTYFLNVRINNVLFNQGSNSINLTNQTNVIIYPTAPDNATYVERFFSGDDKVYTYQIYDTSNIKSLTNISNSNTKKGFVRMFLDNAQGIMYANFNNINGTSNYEDVISGTINASELRFTYLPGDEGSSYHVKEITYSYYEFDPEAYKEITSDYIDTYNTNTQNGVPYPTYPFKKTPSLSNAKLKVDNSALSLPSPRVCTEIINQTSEDGKIKTKLGFYVIKREYDKVEGGDYSKDGVIRYYTYVVDRTGIIEIDTNVADENIYQFTGTVPDMLYQTGSGIVFDFSNPVNNVYDTYYTALQIQQYLRYSKISDNPSITIVDTNKLPVTVNLPLDKYNTDYTLFNSTDSNTYRSYTTETTKENSYQFGLKMRISTNSDQTIIFDNTESIVNINTTYVNSTTHNNVYAISLIHEGEYDIKIWDSSDNRSSVLSGEKEAEYRNYYNFKFKITHQQPEGQFYSKYNDNARTDMMLDLVNNGEINGIQYSTFKSINNDSLRFRFRKNEDQYKAVINPDNIVITKTVNGNTTTLVNGTRPSDDVMTFVPDYTGSETGYYIITIYDEVDYKNSNKTYLGGSGTTRDYMLAKSQNITYTVVLQYIGNESDYVINVTENGVQKTKNFFKSTFNITLDRIKPTYNYQRLIEDDNKKFNASRLLNQEQMDNYFFAVDSSFTFIQNSALGGTQDSSEFFYRKLDTNQHAYPEYYKTYTPDDENYYTEGNSSHIRFSDSDSTFTKDTIGYHDANDGSTNKIINISDLLSTEGFYEIVERDEAGNYRVYALYYNPNGKINQIHFDYNAKLQSEKTSGLLPDTKNGYINSAELLGNNLNFIGIDGSNDYFYKCIITYGTTTVTLINNPNDNLEPTSWEGFLKKINDALEFTKTVTKSGHKVIITFVNRLSDNYVITYRVPGDRLEPIIEDVSSTQFTITIPNDNDSTYIKEFHVWKFINSTWVEQSQDSLGNTIIKSYSTGTSLQGAKYTFGLGEFRFQLIDIFDRGKDLELYPPYYKGMGVNDVRTINYGTSITDNGVVNTANNVTLKYQTNLYLISIYLYDSTSGTYNLINTADYAANGIIEQSLNNGVRTLLFQNNAKNTIRQFKVELMVEKTKTLYTEIFAINKTLPEIELRNQSGGKLISSSNSKDPTIHTENFYIAWDKDYKFEANVSLLRTYTDNSGKQQTEHINNIANGYEVNLPGTYTATISNSLGYSDTTLNIYFKLVSGEIVVYDVIQINNGVETILKPSPKTTTYLDAGTGSTKILYSYYALMDYNNPQGSDKYIEIRANKNKGIECELIESTIDNEDSILKKKVYKVVGKSNYGYERYIEIVFVDKVNEANDLALTNISALYPSDNAGTLTSLPLSSDVKTNVNKLILTWKAYNTTENNLTELRGNLIYADYYFNGKFVKTIYDEVNDTNTLTLTTAGIHRIKLYDLAGNIQNFGSVNEMTINLVNNVLFKVNNKEPINNQIFNDNVEIEITNRYLYYSDPTITATLNGKEFTPEKVGTSFYEYKFMNHGYYEVTITTKITQNESVTTKYCFTIINPNIALPCFSIPQNSNFTVIQVFKQNSDITHNLESLNELWISPESLGTGNYTITLSKYNETLNKDVEFTFKVWVNNEIPYVYSSTPFGTGSTKQIVITYNPKIIYDQIGVGYIAITGMSNINITAESPNEISYITLTENREYWIQIFSADNKLINSYKVTKQEPLNTTSIIIIVVSSVVVVGLIVVFIVIRRHLKFR